MLRCPHCDLAIELRQLRHRGWWRSDRVCPDCKGGVLTILATLGDERWWIATCASFVPLAWLIWYGNRRVRLVPFGRDT